MLTKLLVTVMTAVLLAVVCFPVQAHDGRIANRIDPADADEQPWGGDSHYTGTDLPQLSSIDPGLFPGTTYFIKLTLDYGWFSITEYVLDVFSVDNTRTATNTAVPINDSSTDNPNNGSGAGIN